MFPLSVSYKDLILLANSGQVNKLRKRGRDFDTFDFSQNFAKKIYLAKDLNFWPVTSLSWHNCHNACQGINRQLRVGPLLTMEGLSRLDWTIKTLSGRILGQQTTQRGLWRLEEHQGTWRTLTSIGSFVFRRHSRYMRSDHTAFKHGQGMKYCQRTSSILKISQLSSTKIF